MIDKYKALREALAELELEASANGGYNPRAKMIIELLRERDELAALVEAKWQSIESAPKDGTTFLADIGYPWPVVCAWHGHHQEWAYAEYQIDMVEGEWVDAYFQTEYEKPDGLRAWMPLPKTNK